MKTTPKRITTLNAQENHAWEFGFTFHLDQGNADSMADKLAWRDLVSEFPRLNNFVGCR
jgi:hypothetical protein